ncbi:hypothetical protein DL98DRAFT_132617 [Cadophora sp. DSE1049]|nr:hypothetical protein DL98DRAFT_132617 [Cadophora sp. DSE1049]
MYRRLTWWSEAMLLGVASPIRAIKIGAIPGSDRGWKRTVRPSLVQNGEPHPPVTIVMLQSVLHIKSLYATVSGISVLCELSSELVRRKPANLCERWKVNIVLGLGTSAMLFGDLLAKLMWAA